MPIINLDNLYNNFPYISCLTSGMEPRVIVVDKENNPIIPDKVLKSRDDPDSTIKLENGYQLHLFHDKFQIGFSTFAYGCLESLSDMVHLNLKTLLDYIRKTHGYDVKLSAANIVKLPSEEGLTKLDATEIYFQSSFFKYSKKHLDNTVQAMDSILGTVFTCLCGEIEQMENRKYNRMIGQYVFDNNKMRFTYKISSNAFLMHPILTNILFDIARQVIHLGQHNLQNLWEETSEEIVKITINNDVELARTVLKRNEKMMKIIINKIYSKTEQQRDKIFEIIYNGALSFIKEPTNIITNWNINSKWECGCRSINKNVRGSIATLMQNEKI